MLKYVFSLIIILVGIISCNRDPKEDKIEDILVSYEGAYLYKQDVEDVIPAGLSKNDSLKVAESYIRNWIDVQLLTDVAEKNISNLDKINKAVEEYRNSLLAYEYRKQMILNDGALYDIPEDTLRAYYENHQSLFRLEEPAVKGIFIKVSEDIPNLKNIRKWYKSTKIADVEKLEKFGLTEAISYNYFRDKWINWAEIQKIIPNDFENPNLFVKTHKTYELTENGFVYLLNISDFKLKGEVVPFELIKPEIKEIYVNRNQRRFDVMLRQKLYDKAVKSGDLVINIKKQ